MKAFQSSLCFGAQVSKIKSLVSKTKKIEEEFASKDEANTKRVEEMSKRLEEFYVQIRWGTLAKEDA